MILPSFPRRREPSTPARKRTASQTLRVRGDSGRTRCRCGEVAWVPACAGDDVAARFGGQAAAHSSGSGHSGACAPSRVGGRSQCAGVSDSTAACRTYVRRPSGVSISSSRSATSSWLGSGALKPRLESPEARQPAPGLRQRHAHVPRAAFAGLAHQRHHRPERHQVAGGVIERLAGQLLGTLDAGGFGLGMVEPARRLHQRVEPAPCRPRDLRVHRPRASPRRCRGASRRRPRARSRARRGRPADSLARTRALRAAGWRAARVLRPRAGRARPTACRGRGRCRAPRGPADADPSRASRRPRARPACVRTPARRSPASGRARARPTRAAPPSAAGAAGASPIRVISISGSAATAWPCACAAHSRRRAHHGGDQLGLGGGRLELFGVPLQERRLHRLALVGALQQLEDAVAMMRKIGVQPHPAAIAGAIDAGDLVPQRRRRLARRCVRAARCGTRSRRGACRPRRSDCARCVAARARPLPARPRRCWPVPPLRPGTTTAGPARRRSA